MKGRGERKASFELLGIDALHTRHTHTHDKIKPSDEQNVADE